MEWEKNDIIHTRWQKRFLMRPTNCWASHFPKKLFETDCTEIMDTEITQVAIFLTRVTYYRVFIEGIDILPDSYAGHSVGEYAALICSRAMRLEDGLSLIRRRGQLMQKVSDDMGDGGMLAIMGMAYPEVEELTEACVKDGTDVCISTYNDIRQMVISGRKGSFLLLALALSAYFSSVHILCTNLLHFKSLWVPCTVWRKNGTRLA